MTSSSWRKHTSAPPDFDLSLDDRQKSGKLRARRQPTERRRHQLQRRHEELQVAVVAAGALEKHEAPGILELALQGDDVEFDAQRRRLVAREPACRRKLAEPFAHESLVQI